MLPFVTALIEAERMMSSRCAAPHHGSGCSSPPAIEAEYMAATVPPIIKDNYQPCIGAGSIYDNREGGVYNRVKMTHYRSA
jgi:hypothetical protein